MYMLSLTASSTTSCGPLLISVVLAVSSPSLCHSMSLVVLVVAPVLPRLSSAVVLQLVSTIYLAHGVWAAQGVYLGSKGSLGSKSTRQPFQLRVSSPVKEVSPS